MSALHAPAASAASTGESTTLESLGRQLRAALPAMRIQSVSLYNERADNLWLSEGALGPDEHNLVLEAIETLTADSTRNVYSRPLEDGRTGLFLPVRAPRGGLVGLCMILADTKTLKGDPTAHMVTAPLRAALQKIAVLLRVKSGHTGNTSSIARTTAPALELLELMPDASPGTPATKPSQPVLEVPHPPPTPALDPVTDLTLVVQLLAPLRSGGRTRRYEVLARSRQDLKRTRVPPEFIAPSASGPQGAVLDSFVVQRLLAWLGENRPVWDGEPASFSVNVSIGALEDKNFLTQLAATLESTGVAPECIGFEISELACIQCRASVERFIAACDKLGCFVVLDSFTLDARVLPLLRSKALRLVKIDARLTTSALQDKLSQAMVVAIVQACKVLGIHCVAKRIESQTAMQWLEAVGCDFAQGLAFEQPVPLESLIPAP